MSLSTAPASVREVVLCKLDRLCRICAAFCLESQNFFKRYLIILKKNGVALSKTKLVLSIKIQLSTVSLGKYVTYIHVHTNPKNDFWGNI